MLTADIIFEPAIHDKVLSDVGMFEEVIDGPRRGVKTKPVSTYTMIY